MSSVSSSYNFCGLFQYLLAGKQLSTMIEFLKLNILSDTSALFFRTFFNSKCTFSEEEMLNGASVIFTLDIF
jgi:hypothetical protein